MVRCIRSSTSQLCLCPSVDSLCHPWFTTTKLAYRFPILKLPSPPGAVLLVQQHYFTLIPLHHATLDYTSYKYSYSCSYNYNYITHHHTASTLQKLQQLWARWPLQPLQLQPLPPKRNKAPDFIRREGAGCRAKTKNPHSDVGKTYHLSVHQWISSGVHASQQPASAIASYLPHFRHRRNMAGEVRQKHLYIYISLSLFNKHCVRTLCSQEHFLYPVRQPSPASNCWDSLSALSQQLFAPPAEKRSWLVQ